MTDEEELQEALGGALADMPAVIEKGLLNPKASATSGLKWAKLATNAAPPLKIFY
jgi:hypothetical protein